MSMTDLPFLNGLNDRQREAAETLDGPVLVLAGAGTGKTRVLTARIAHLIAARKAWPSQILAVTFTNKAAREMLDRIAALVGPMAQDLWLGTFHALSARLLRRHAELVGLKSSFTILDADDQLRLLKQIMAAAGIDDKRWPARVLLGAIERWKDRGLTPQKLAADAGGELAGGRAVALYAAYQERLKILNACDFGDLMLHMVTLFTEHPDILAQYQDKFRYILVDEYQDTNVAQYLWLRLLAQGHRNICCVGDDDQSIYGWRGAEVGNILKFEQDFPGAKVIRLEQNYRSTPHILAAASGLISHNQDRLGKTLWTDQAEGDTVRVRGFWDGPEEARWVGDEIEALQREGRALSDIAILVRAGFQTREFEERLLTIGVPYRVVGGARFYERQEIRDAIAYLRVVAQPDDDLALERIINTPRRGLGDAALQTLHRSARAMGTSLMVAAHGLIGTDELRPAPRRAIAQLVQDFDRWRALAEGMPPGELAETVLDESGYTAMWKADKSPEAPGRLDNLRELITALEEFETLAAFLEHVSLVMERNQDSGGAEVTLMTLHAAKGLEFDCVFLPGWEEGLFPHQRALDESGAKGLEEERRLAYVGLTRARQRAYVSHVANRRIHNQWQSAIPSRFLEELPAEHVDSDTADSGLSPSHLMPARTTLAAWGNGQGGGGGQSWQGGVRWGSSAARPAGRAPVIDAVASRVEVRSAPALKPGDRVFHLKFGMGDVLAVEGERIEVNFDHTGSKRVMAGFLEKKDN